MRKLIGRMPSEVKISLLSDALSETIDQRNNAQRERNEALRKLKGSVNMKALGRMLEAHYGRSNGDYLLNYATLWDTLLDGLQQGTIDLTDIDKHTERKQDASN